MPQNPIFTVFNATAGADTVFQVTTLDLWFKELDIFVYDNDADLGQSTTSQPITIYTNDVYTIKGYVNVGQLYFKNTNAGSNTQITISGVQCSDKEIKENGLI